MAIESRGFDENPPRICEPFSECGDFDGRLLFTRTFTGGPLSEITQDLPLGNNAIPGAQLLPYAKTKFVQTWKTREACLAPARSIIGLAPGEELVFEQRVARQFDFSSVITRNQEFSSTFTSETRTENEDIETSTESTSRSTTDTDTVDLGPLGTWGSGGDASATTVEEVVERTVRTLKETLNSVSTTQMNGLTTEVSSSTTVTTETSISRRIVNPLGDRTLELRFHPVFRRFTVTTSFDVFEFGMLVRPLDVRFDRDFVIRNPRFVNKVVPQQVTWGMIPSTDPTALSAYTRLVQPDPMNAVVSELGSTPQRNTRRFLLYMRNAEGLTPFRQLATVAISGDRNLAKSETLPIQGGFAIDSLRVRGRDIEVPARSPELFLEAVNLPVFERGILTDLARPDVLERFRSRFTFTTDVLMFIGTHLEAVPGNCEIPIRTQS